MSLKKFHLIFILVSSAFMIYFGYWAYSNWIYYADTSYLTYMIIAVVSFILLIVYYQKFLKTYKGIIN